MRSKPLAVFVFGLVLVNMEGSTRAQAPSRAVAPSEDDDLLRPYSARPRVADDARGYARRPSVRQQTPPARPNPYAQRRTYFPGLRSGQGPNQSVPMRAHCVPGRHAFLGRR